MFNVLSLENKNFSSAIAFSFFTLTPSKFAQSSHSWCLSETTDQELFKTALGSLIWTLFDAVTPLKTKRALFLGHPVVIHFQKIN